MGISSGGGYAVVSFALVISITFGGLQLDPAEAAGVRLTGAGGETCDAFLKRAGTNGLSDPAAVQWVLGYLTGRAVASPDLPHRPFRGPEGIAADVRAYCQAHPGAQVADAATSFFDPFTR